MSEIAQLRGATVLAVGDVMLDEYVWGVVDRISPEAPVPVVEVRRRTHAAGGAANVAAGVIALGGRAFLTGVVGDDVTADALRSVLANSGVDPDDLVVDPTRPTTSKMRVIAHAQQIVRTDVEDSRPLSESVEADLLRRLEGHLDQVDAVVLSDYRKGVVSEAVARGVIEAAGASGTPVIVDPKGLHYAKYSRATVITPNAHDAGQAANIHIEDEADLLAVANRLSAECGGAALLITRGAAGMTLFSEGSRFDVPTRARDVYDVTGAGDTVVAMLAVALGRRWDLEKAVTLANAAAGVAVGKVGTATVTLEELESSLEG